MLTEAIADVSNFSKNRSKVASLCCHGSVRICSENKIGDKQDVWTHFIFFKLSPFRPKTLTIQQSYNAGSQPLERRLGSTFLKVP